MKNIIINMSSHTAILGLLTLIQLISTLALVMGWKEPTVFSIEHEDLISIIMLSAFFITTAIDKSRTTILHFSEPVEQHG